MGRVIGMVIIIIEVTVAETTTRVIVLREERITEATPRTAIQLLGVVVETIAIDLIAAEITIPIVILRDTIVIIVAEITEKEEDIPNEEIHEVIVLIVVVVLGIAERNIKRKKKKKKKIN